MSYIPGVQFVASASVLRAIPAAAAPQYPTMEVTGTDSRYGWNSSDSRSDNGRSIIKPTDGGSTGRWNLLDYPYAVLNALDYGVMGDGVTDDTSAINAFLTLASNAGLIAYFPGNRTYLATSGGLSAPAGVYWKSGPGAVFRQNTTGTPLVTFNSNCVIEGGEFNSTIVDGTSTTSINLTGLSGPVTVNTQAGITTFVVSGFARVYSRANPANAFDGIVVSYNSVTGALVLNPVFPQGSGTHTDWNINQQSVAMISNTGASTTGATIRGVTYTGNWYLGLQLFAVNATGTALSVANCNVEDCTAVSCQNRGFYLNGNIAYCNLVNCTVTGNGVTNYGFNLNPGNTGSGVNQIQYCRLTDCLANGSIFQGFAYSERTFNTVLTNCSAIACTNSSSTGAGFLFQEANTGGIPEFNMAIGCVATSCDIGFELVNAFYDIISAASAYACGYGARLLTSTEYVSLIGFQAISCTSDGINVSGTSVRCNLNNVNLISNGGYGVNIATGASVTLVTGRAYNNTSGNLNDAGTGTVSTGLVTA